MAIIDLTPDELREVIQSLGVWEQHALDHRWSAANLAAIRSALEKCRARLAELTATRTLTEP